MQIKAACKCLQAAFHICLSLTEYFKAVSASDKGFRLCGLFDGTKWHLRTQSPRSRQVPSSGNGIVYQWVVMLQSRAQAQFRQGSPHHELRHACVLLRKLWKFVGIQWELCLLAFDDFLVFKEQNSAHTSSETAINFAFSLGKLCTGQAAQDTFI